MSMRKVLILIAVLSLTMSVLSMEATAKKLGAANDVKALSEPEQMKLVLSAAPTHIATEAAVMVFGNDGQLKEARPSTNGFTCIPTVMNLPDPGPMCMDAAVHPGAAKREVTDTDCPDSGS